VHFEDDFPFPQVGYEKTPEGYPGIKHPKEPFQVGGFNPFEKYDRQNGNLPQIGVNIKNI